MFKVQKMVRKDGKTLSEAKKKTDAQEDQLERDSQNLLDESG